MSGSDELQTDDPAPLAANARAGRFGWWRPEAGMVVTVTIGCCDGGAWNCMAVTVTDELSKRRAAAQAEREGWRFRGGWMCPACVEVADDAATT